MLITCYEIIIKYKDKRNIFSLVYENDKYGERKKEGERVSICLFLSRNILQGMGDAFYRLLNYPPLKVSNGRYYISFMMFIKLQIFIERMWIFTHSLHL